MDVKFTLKDMGDEFFRGWSAFGKEIKGFDDMTPAEKYDRLVNMSDALPKNCKRQEASFRDRVDLNSILKRDHRVMHNSSPRKGYVVHTFSFISA